MIGVGILKFTIIIIDFLENRAKNNNEKIINDGMEEYRGS